MISISIVEMNLEFLVNDPSLKMLPFFDQGKENYSEYL